MYRSLVLLVALTCCLTGAVWAADEVEDAPKAVQVFKSIEGVAPYFDTAYGYAVFPHIGKGGLGVGAARGKGQVYVGDKITGVATVSEISWGLQAGGQAYRQIIFFEDASAYKNFISGNFEFDAGAGAIAVTASGEAKAGTTGSQASGSAGGESGAAASGREYRKGMQVFTVGLGGLMYEASIAGQKYKFKPAS